MNVSPIFSWSKREPVIGQWDWRPESGDQEKERKNVWERDRIEEEEEKPQQIRSMQPGETVSSRGSHSWG